MSIRQKITPYLWFDSNAAAAVDLYVSVFARSRVVGTVRYAEGGMMPAGLPMAIEFELEGQRFVALNGGPHFQLNEAVSFFVECADQAEIDRLWAVLGDGGQYQQCGWLRDRFGLAWQINCGLVADFMADRDEARRARVLQAMMAMVKIDIAVLKAAYDG
ncbi:VOC family protein [Zavarzinia compransoris]|uniref:PhnB-like domain-containing protein n=1 Tax=Zavarzinia compransoris TaxID=1264899 RepID=A0A317E223_9PROT|nr:VOC family protein [Zavarzinia compransoris]PWR21029.1 hypothetical protein DKG75_13660 [Zavarzinia compransoris]TDP44061.1 putative 3-demethylubiquinone-9 3-methyltransferase (glyoxalase superfamily) [Zavarzinia compransoris]